MPNRKIKIRLSSPENWFPEHLKSADGSFCFDINKDTVVAITKQIDSVSDPGKLKQNTVRNFSLPTTKKNVAFFGEIGNPNVVNFNHYQPIFVNIIIDSYVLPEQKFNIKSITEKNTEVEALGDQADWVDKLAVQKLINIPMGITPAYDWDFILDLHQNHYSYQDGELPIFVPFVNYGKRKQKDRVSVEDLRIWHSLLYILKYSFCKAGWTFNCPMLETEQGRRLWIYILSEDYASKIAQINTGFNAILTLDFQIPLAVIGGATIPVVFQNDSVSPGYDNGNFYNNVTGEYQGQGTTADYFVKLRIEGVGTSVDNTGAVLFSLTKEISGGLFTQFQDLDSKFITDLPTGIHDISLEALNVQLNINEKLYVTIYHAKFPGAVKQFESKFYSIPSAATISEGDFVDAAEIIDPSYYALDCFKGAAHLFNWKVETDSDLKIVSCYPEDKAAWYDEGSQEGFFKSNSEAVDWSKKVVCKSLQENINVTQKRNILLEFKEDSDDFKANNTGFEYPLFSKNIDFGELYKSGTDKFPNPFFSPTMSDFDLDVRWIWSGSTFPDSVPYMPQIWSANKDGAALPEQAVKIAPRILMTHQYMRVRVPNSDINGLPTSMDIKASDANFPDGYRNLAFYAPASQIFPKDFVSFTPFGIRLDDKAIVYGSDQINETVPDNHELFYKKNLIRYYKNIPIEFLIKLTFLDFVNFSHRQKIHIVYDSLKYGKLNFFSRVVAINDFVLNKNIPTPVLLMPDEANFSTDCCDCVAIARFIGFNSPTLDFIIDLAGNCGAVLSYQWQLVNNNPSTNIGIVGLSTLQTVKVSGNGSINTFSFTLNATIVTDCGTYQTSINYQ
jgi:hypothetical protein